MDESYVSPSSSETGRRLQSGSTDIGNAIMCMAPGDAASFEVSQDSFPVYLKDSVLNSNKAFDYGEFETLKTQLVNSKLDMSSFFFTFEEKGSYLFGDYSDTAGKQTLFVIKNDCPEAVLPMTLANLNKLGVTVYHGPMDELSQALVLIPLSFILLAVGITVGLSHMEAYLKRRE